MIVFEVLKLDIQESQKCDIDYLAVRGNSGCNSDLFCFLLFKFTVDSRYLDIGYLE